MTALAVVMRGNGLGNGLLQLLRPLLGQFEIVTQCHELPPMLGKARPSAPSTHFRCAWECARVPVSKTRNSPEAPPAKSGQSLASSASVVSCLIGASQLRLFTLA